MPEIIPPPSADSHPHCPACGLQAVRWSVRQADGVATAYGVCGAGHLYQMRWAVTA